MKIITKSVLDMRTMKWIPELEESFQWFGPVELADRSASAASKGARDTAANTASTFGGEAQANESVLNPFYTNEMKATHAFSPNDTAELLTAAEAGSGGATGALTGEAQLQAARTRNPSGFAKSLDEMARDQQKTAAGASENIAAQDVLGAQALRQEGAAGEAGLFGENLKGQLGAMGIEEEAIKNQMEAGKSGWLQNLNNTISTLSNAFKNIKGK